MRLKPEVLKVGDKVRDKVSGDQGTVIIARVPPHGGLRAGPVRQQPEGRWLHHRLVAAGEDYPGLMPLGLLGGPGAPSGELQHGALNSADSLGSGPGSKGLSHAVGSGPLS
jgi:hypothetical protein